ncbi:MAG: TonB-dependent receptor [Desulfobacteraceae bacterium]|nr:TonB-dependent receptor [Desulfobacteraceae bacterium]
MNKPKRKIAVLLTACLILASPIDAKETTAPDEITVTAQKIEENIQEVPISITVFDEFAIKDRQIESVKDIAQYTPNFLLPNLGDNGILAPTIRGMSSDPHLISTTVSMYMDGVPTFNSIGYDAALEDIERIEVLKGPQGTLYGKNAEAGVINIITKKPGNEIRAKIAAELGNDDKRQLAFSASGPVVKDKFYIGLSGKHYEKDGYLKNIYLDQTYNDRKNNYGKINLRYTPNDNLEISLISSKFKRDDGAASLNLMTAKDKRELSSDIQGTNKSETTAHAFKIEYDFDKYKLESISAHKEDQDIRLSDSDFSPLMINQGPMKFSYKNNSQEVKLSSQTENFNWLVGLYADKGKKTGGYTIHSIYPEYAGRYDSESNDESIGVFVHADYKINNKLSVLAGIRYDKDKRETDDKKQDVQLSSSFGAVSPKIALEYKFDKDIMMYATVAKGYKSGGFYMLAAPGFSKEYDQETLLNYEIGLKSSFLDNKLVLNSAIYCMDISDQQVLTAIDSMYGYISNAASATSKGIELEINYQANDNLSLFSAFGYNETDFDKFSDAKGDYKGNHNPFAPVYNYSLGAQYRNANGCYARINLNGYGKMYLDKANKYKQNAYDLVNAKIGYETNRFDIYLYATNLFDKNHDTEGYYGGSYVFLSDPREIGARFVYRF